MRADSRPCESRVALRIGQVADDVDQDLFRRLEAERRRVADVELDDAAALFLEALGLLEHRAADVVADVFELARLAQIHAPHHRTPRPTGQPISVRAHYGRLAAWNSPTRSGGRRMIRTYDPDRPVPRETIEELLARRPRAVGRVLPGLAVSRSG